MREDDFGPFKVGEVVVLVIDCWALDRCAGDEVTIANEFGLHRVVDGMMVAGWVLEEHAWWGARVIAIHGQVKRRRPPEHPFVRGFNERLKLEEELS